MIGPCQPIKRCRPPSEATASAPGRKYRWYVLANSTSAPISRSSAGVTPLTVPAVPTNAKKGVSTAPWGVCNTPDRARLAADACLTWKLKPLPNGSGATNRPALREHPAHQPDSGPHQQRLHVHSLQPVEVHDRRRAGDQLHRVRHVAEYRRPVVQPADDLPAGQYDHQRREA